MTLNLLHYDATTLRQPAAVKIQVNWKFYTEVTCELFVKKSDFHLGLVKKMDAIFYSIISLYTEKGRVFLI